jgi:opacity protein-like surface antigen
MTRRAALITDHDTPRHRDTEAAHGAAVLGASLPRCVVIACLVAVAMTALCPAAAHAQAWGARGFFDVGATTFTASQSFEAILGSATGTVFGGGGDVVLPQRIFGRVRASRFGKTGQRVFVFEGETFDLGIETNVRIAPVDVTGGYRFFDADRRVVPYLGAGLGWHRYEETSEFAEDDENVDERHRGYHVLGGAEVRLARWLGVGGELQWTTVPEALGQDPNGVSAAFEETDLGGVSFRVNVIVGRW